MKDFQRQDFHAESSVSVHLLMKGAPCPSNSPAWAAQQHPGTTESSKILLIASDTFCSSALQMLVCPERQVPDCHLLPVFCGTKV